LRGEDVLIVDSLAVPDPTASWGALSLAETPAQERRRRAFVSTGNSPGRLLVVATPAGIEHYFEEAGGLDQARTLLPAAGAPDLELVTRTGTKFGFDLLGPPLSKGHS
jgi:hypothetical protein